MKAKKMGFVYCAKGEQSWWKTHLMAPAPMIYDNYTIRVFVGCWDKNGISRIGYIDVDRENPCKVLKISERPVLDIGDIGCFDDNGVFPAHVYKISDHEVRLYYTGFQKGDKISFYNFTGCAISCDNGNNFQRLSKAPTLDRADEGLYTRAGQSIYPATDGGFHCVYSAGSGWYYIGGKERPIYEVFYQKSNDGIHLLENGTKIIGCDLNVEHGLGRPQIIQLGEYYWVFYTRRIIENMRYFLGCARTKDFKNWERRDDVFKDISFGESGSFDEKMIYFPGVVKVSNTEAYCFYTGNHYGEDGLGCIKLTF